MPNSKEPFVTELEEIPNKDMLDDAQIEALIDREWKTYGKAGAEEVVEKVGKRRGRKPKVQSIQNLVQYREKDERTPEQKRKIIENIRVASGSNNEDEDVSVVEFPPEIIEPETLRQILTKTEQRYFIRRWQEYMAEHQGDFNKAEDYDCITELILCHIHEIRIFKRIKNAPTLATDKNTDIVMHNIHNRINNLRMALKTRRKDRIEAKETRTSQFLGMITELAKQGQGSNIINVMKQRVIEQEEAEEEMLARKRLKQ